MDNCMIVLIEEPSPVGPCLREKEEIVKYGYRITILEAIWGPLIFCHHNSERK